MAMISVQRVSSRAQFLFDGQARAEDMIFEAVKAEAARCDLNAKIETKKMKSGGFMITKSKEEIIRITSKGFSDIYIITRTVGTYLYVSIVTMSKPDAQREEDIFLQETFYAYWFACILTLLKALKSIGLDVEEELKTVLDKV